VVGDGEQRPALERLSRELGIEGSVDFLGYRRDLPAIAAAADYCAVSSDKEGTPVSLIEGAAAARPAVATAVGGVLHRYSATRLVADIAGLCEQLLERRPLQPEELRSS
jgi:glycosyltransferase involved in cell wall biosynthesis